MPVIQPIIAERGLGGAPQPTVQSDGSIGRAVQGLGNALENAAQAQQEMNLRRQQMDMSIRDFRADQNFRQFQEGLGSTLDDAKGTMDPSGQGLTTHFVEQFDKKSADFLASVPEGLKPKFSELIQTSRAGWVDKVAHAEREQRYSWFRTGITDSQEKLQAQVFNDPATYDAAKSDGLRAIEASGLPEAEKEVLRKKWDETLGLTIGERDVRDAQENPALAKEAARRYGVPGAGGNVVDRIIGVESGGNANAKNPNSSASGPGQFLDATWLAMVKKYRPDVAQGKSASQILALKSNPSLAREMTAAYATENGNFLNAEGLQASPGNVYLAHFLGPRGATQVLKADPNTPIEGIVGQDVVKANPFLKGKSASEVAAWAAKKMGSDQESVPADPRLAGLSLSDRLKLYDRTLAAAKQGQAEINAQRKTQQDQTYDNLRLGIETGDVVSEQSILNSPNIDNGQKATLLNTLRTRQGEDTDVSAYIAAWSQGSDAAKINPFDSKEAALNNKAFDKIMKNAPDDQKQAITEQYVKSTGNIPNATVAEVRQGLASSNVAEVADGMEKAARLYQVAPEAMDAVSNGKDLKDAALAYNEYVYGRGMTGQGAGQRWLDQHSPEALEKRERLKKPAQDFLKTLSVSDVTSALDTSILPFTSPSAGLTPDQQAAVMTDYSQIAEEKFLQTGGDADLAKKLALQDMTKLYGVSDVSGNGVVTKFPPEHYYPPIAGSQDYIRDAALKDVASYVAGPIGSAKGLIEPGNIDLGARPIVKNSDGTISTVRSMSFEEDGKEVLVPTVSPDGKILSDQDAIDLYHKTGQFLGKFDSAGDATAYAQKLHQAQASYYADGNKVLNVNLVPTKETADDIRLHKPPRYRLMFQRQDGVWDAIPGQLFSVGSDEIKSLMQADSQKRLDAAKAVHQQSLDEQAASDKALEITVGPDWMKARAAEAARERQKMRAGEQQMNTGDGKMGQEFIKGLSETIANPPPF